MRRPSDGEVVRAALVTGGELVDKVVDRVLGHEAAGFVAVMLAPLRLLDVAVIHRADEEIA